MRLAAENMHDPAVESALAPGDTPAPPPGLLVADFFTQGPGYHSRRRAGTQDWLVTYTRGGCGRYRLRGQEFRCVEGDVLALQPGTPHDYGTEPSGGRWEFYWAHFLPQPHWSSWLLWPEWAHGLRGVRIGDPAARRRIEEVFDRLLRNASSLDAWGERLAENALEELILLVAREDARGDDEATDPRVRVALRLISQRYREPLTVAELAEAVHLSPSRLAHLFTETVGEAPMQMLVRLRLRQAARLLEFSTLGVGEVAAEVGFESPFYFSRQFSQHFGMSPRAYRRRHREEGTSPGFLLALE